MTQKIALALVVFLPMLGIVNNGQSVALVVPRTWIQEKNASLNLPGIQVAKLPPLDQKARPSLFLETITNISGNVSRQVSIIHPSVVSLTDQSELNSTTSKPLVVTESSEPEQTTGSSEVARSFESEILEEVHSWRVKRGFRSQPLLDKQFLSHQWKAMGVAARALATLTTVGISNVESNLYLSASKLKALKQGKTMVTRNQSDLTFFDRFFYPALDQKPGGYSIFVPDSSGACFPFEVGKCLINDYDNTEIVAFWTPGKEYVNVSLYTAIPRSKSAASSISATSLKCPPLSSFYPVDPQDLRCGKIEQELQNQKEKTVKRVDLSSIAGAGEACRCLEFTQEKYCYTNFFGPKEKWEKHYQSKISERSSCIEACQAVQQNGQLSGTLDKTPDYDCFWLQTKKTTGKYWVVDTQTVRTYGPQRVLSGGPIKEAVDCKMEKDSACIGVGDSIVVPKGGFNYYFPEKKESSLQMKVVKGSGSYSGMTAPGLGTTYVKHDCFVPYFDGKYVAGIDGTLWDYSGLETKTPQTACKEVPKLGTTTTFSFDSLFKETWELRRELLNCQTRKQVLINALQSGAPIEGSIFEGLTLKDSQNFIVAVYKGHLVGAQCSPISYDELVWAGHDAWIVRKEGVVLGCMDARLGAIFADCMIYNETTAYKVDYQWEVECDKSCWATYKEGSIDRQVAVISDFVSEMTAFLDTVISPPLYPPNTGGIVMNEPTIEIGETTGGPFDWFMNLDIGGKIGTILGITLGIILSIGLIWVAAKVCKAYSKRKVAAEQRM